MINKENNKLSIPKSIKNFSEAELNNLAKKIRNFMIEKNSSTRRAYWCKFRQVELTIAYTRYSSHLKNRFYLIQDIKDIHIKFLLDALIYFLLLRSMRYE